MPVNHELTNIIKARVIRRFKESGGELVISFHDGSAMKIRDMETNSPPLAAGAQIKEVEEDGTEFTIRCEDGTSLSLQLTVPGSGVSVRDKHDQVEYFGQGAVFRVPLSHQNMKTGCSGLASLWVAPKLFTSWAKFPGSQFWSVNDPVVVVAKAKSLS